MALTKISTDGVKDDAITKAKIPANQIEASELANDAVDTNAIQDDAVTEDKLANSINSAIAANTAKDLTALSASNLTSGTIPDARLPATLPAISGANLTNLPPSGQAHNLVINGNFKIAQRSTSHNSSGYRTVDRWKMSAGGASATLTQSQYNQISGTPPYAEGHHQAYRFDNAGQNANNQGYVYMLQNIEAQDIVNSGWNYKSSSSYLTLSFWIRGSVTQTYLINIMTNDGTVREWSHLVSLTADQWTKVTMTVPGDSNITMNDDNGTGLALYFYAYLGDHYTSGSTVNQWVTHSGYNSRPDMGAGWWTTSNSTFMLTGVQLEAGNTASNFSHESYAETLRKCQRYYWKIASNKYRRINGYKRGDSNCHWELHCPVPMRTAPSPTLLASGTFTDFQSNFNTTQSSPTIGEWNTDTGQGLLQVSSNWNQTHYAIRSWEGYSIEFSAEL